MAQLAAFLEGTPDVDFRAQDHEGERYAFIGSVVARLAYRRLRRADKGVVMRYLRRTTGYFRPQLTRLIGRCLQGQKLATRYRRPQHGFPCKYTAADVTLLAQTDALHQTLSGPATRCLMQRAFTVYGDARYARLATLSVGPPVQPAPPGRVSGHPPATQSEYATDLVFKGRQHLTDFLPRLLEHSTRCFSARGMS